MHNTSRTIATEGLPAGCYLLRSEDTVGPGPTGWSKNKNGITNIGTSIRRMQTSSDAAMSMLGVFHPEAVAATGRAAVNGYGAFEHKA